MYYNIIIELLKFNTELLHKKYIIQWIPVSNGKYCSVPILLIEIRYRNVKKILCVNIYIFSEETQIIYSIIQNMYMGTKYLLRFL